MPQTNAPKTIQLKNNRTLVFDHPIVMGILNVTPDSFSDGGDFVDFDKAVERALVMVEEGAEIIDIGGESSRPGAEPVSVEAEIARVAPVIKALREKSDIPLSIDTYKAETAQKALEAGADIINDISALRFDPKMAQVVADNDVPLIMMHLLGTPQNMQNNPSYNNCVAEISVFFKAQIQKAVAAGIKKESIIIDPGIGFGKRLEDNLALLAQLDQFKSFGCPILVGSSRKSFINMVSPSKKTARERLGGSIASALLAFRNGADILRVHDVHETVEALKVAEAIWEKM